MKRIIGWLETMLTRRPDSVADDQPDALPDDYAVDVPSDAEVAAWMEDNEPVEDECVATVPCLSVLDTDSSEIDKSTGIDPYDTAQLHKK